MISLPRHYMRGSTVNVKLYCCTPGSKQMSTLALIIFANLTSPKSFFFPLARVMAARSNLNNLRTRVSSQVAKLQAQPMITII